MTSEGQGRLIVYARSHGRCEACGRPASEWHHRLNRSQGGTWSPANGLHLCRWCHQWITEHPDLGRLLGLSLPRGTDPAVYPVWMQPTGWGRDWWQLDSDGMLHFVHHPHPDPAAAGRAQQAFSDARRLGLVIPPGVCV